MVLYCLVLCHSQCVISCVISEIVSEGIDRGSLIKLFAILTNFDIKHLFTLVISFQAPCIDPEINLTVAEYEHKMYCVHFHRCTKFHFFKDRS